MTMMTWDLDQWFRHGMEYKGRLIFTIEYVITRGVMPLFLCPTTSSMCIPKMDVDFVTS